MDPRYPTYLQLVWSQPQPAPRLALPRNTRTERSEARRRASGGAGGDGDSLNLDLARAIESQLAGEFGLSDEEFAQVFAGPRRAG
jgi:hypothetical protein